MGLRICMDGQWDGHWVYDDHGIFSSFLGCILRINDDDGTSRLAYWTDGIWA